MKRNSGFSLLEITVVIFVMGLTITALLQMFDFSHLRYKAIARGWQERALLAETRIWIRSRVLNSESDKITLKSFTDEVKIPAGFLIETIKIVKREGATLFVKVEYADDMNRNGKAEPREISSRLFCFRGRSA